MGTQERRERERIQIRERILEAALGIIAEAGFAGLSMRKLAECVEYSPAAIYLHFKSREQIAQELSEKGFERFLNQLDRAAAGKSAAQALAAFSAAYVAFGLANAELYRLILMSDSAYMAAAYAEPRGDSAAARAYGQLFGLAQQLRDAAPGGDATEPAVLADMIWATLHGIVSLHIACAAFQSASPENLARYATEMLCNGLHLEVAPVPQPMSAETRGAP